jgi:alanine racemase
MSTAPDAIRPDVRPTWAEVDLTAFDRNIDAILARLPEGSRLIAVLKANAYGHGAVALARRCDPARVAMIATSLLEESLELRRAGIEMPLLVLGPLNEAQVREAVENEIRIGIPGPEELAIAGRIARDREVIIHLKLDSGMGRMGLVESELADAVDRIRQAAQLNVEAIYTHFANADDPTDPFTADQIARFRTLVATLDAAGVKAPLHHLANSAATMRSLVVPGEFVRVGLALYGAEAVQRLEPLLRWRTAIARLKELPPGHAIGYGTTFITKRPSRIATLPVGYADGYSRGFSNRGEVLVRGMRVPVVGRVSMDLVTIDVTDVEDAKVGDEVVLLGRQGNHEISVEELAAKLGTISYEVLCNVGARVPRIYLDA